MGGGGGGQRDHPVRAKSAGGRTVAAGPCRRAGPTGAGPRHDPRAAVARQACPDSHGGDAGVTYDAAPGSSEIPLRLAADVDTGGGVGTTPRAGRRGPALVVMDAGASHDADGSTGGGPEIYLPLADRDVIVTTHKTIGLVFRTQVYKLKRDMTGKKAPSVASVPLLPKGKVEVTDESPAHSSATAGD